MQTSLVDSIRGTRDGQQADAILRSCVHCGFCTATCPTYQLLGNELDGPRGRIYLMKGVLEGEIATSRTLLHLDRCLTCRSCETTCPSGVRYSRLLEIGRAAVEKQVSRPLPQRIFRWLLLRLLPYARRFRFWLRVGQWVRPLVPPSLRRKIPPRRRAGLWPEQSHARRMLVLDGCVQPAAAPDTNAAAARVMDRLGITLIRAPEAGCCGAASHHLSASGQAAELVRRNIDAWWPFVEQGVEAIVVAASACGLFVKEYGELLEHDPAYAEKAARISTLAKGLGEVLAAENLSPLGCPGSGRKIAFHAPCTLQHGQRGQFFVQEVLQKLGFELLPVTDGHLCCGSAGTYSLLQPELSARLLENKVAALERERPDLIATANIGCQLHLETKAGVPVHHWIELCGA